MCMVKGLPHFQWSHLLGSLSCVCDRTKLWHWVLKYHQFLLQHDSIRDAFSCHLSSSEKESKVSKKKMACQLCLSAWLCKCCSREDGSVHTVVPLKLVLYLHTSLEINHTWMLVNREACSLLRVRGRISLNQWLRADSKEWLLTNDQCKIFFWQLGNGGALALKAQSWK